MKKEELIKIIGKSQDGGVDVINNPNDKDNLSKLLKTSVEQADEIIDVVRDIDYAIAQLNKAKAEVEKLDLSQAII